VVAGGPLRHVERGRELADARRPFPEETDDPCAQLAAERAELDGVFDDEDLVALVFGEQRTVDNY
jgi:hypothetical protein